MNPVQAGIDAQFRALGEPMGLPEGAAVQCVVTTTGGSTDTGGLGQTHLSAGAWAVHVQDISRLVLDLTVTVRERGWVITEITPVNAVLHRVTLVPA